MSVTIACPKCHKKYRLPDTALGRKVQCKACQTSFQTRSRKPIAQPSGGEAASASQRASKSQPSAAELAEFGLAGPLKRQADLFDEPNASAGGRTLNNFAADPGFSLPTKHQSARSQASDNPYASPSPPDNEFAAVLANPVLAGKQRSGQSDRSDPTAEYGKVRLGLRVVYACWSTIALVFIGSIVVGILRSLMPGVFSTFQPEGALATIGSITQVSVIAIQAICAVAYFVGQCICLGTPEDDEVKYIQLTVGTTLLAIVLMFVAVAMAALSAAGAAPAVDGEAPASAGFGVMLIAGVATVVVAYLAYLSSTLFFNYYLRAVATNLNTKKAIKTAQRTITLWYWSIGLPVIGSLVIGLTVAVASLAGAQSVAGLMLIPLGGIWIVSSILAFVILWNLITTIELLLKRLKPKAS